jgi:ribosomal protein S27E
MMNLAAMGFQETKWGRSDDNIGHTQGNFGPEQDSYSSFINAYNSKMKDADRLKIKDEATRLQVYNGLGKIFPSTEADYHGFKMKKIYGVEVPRGGIDLRKNPLYGKQVMDIRDNVLKRNPEFMRYMDSTYRAPMPEEEFAYGGQPCYECGGAVKRYDMGGYYDCPDQEKDPETGKCKAEVVRGREAAAANKAASADMNAWAKQVAAMDKEVARQNAAQTAGQLSFDYDWMQSPVDKADKKAAMAQYKQFFQQNPNTFVPDDTSGYSPEQKYIIASKLKQRMSTPMGAKLAQQQYGVDPRYMDLQRLQSEMAPKMGGWNGMRNWLFNVYKQQGGMIEDPRGQWAHPGQNTRIPGSDITMQGVPYPVYGMPNKGRGMMMYPGENYSFPNADYVDEYPMMQNGGLLSRTVSCSNCGHSWKAVDGGSDPMTCHKCGGAVKMQGGGTAYVDSVLNANKNLNWVQRLYPKNTPSMQIPGVKGPSTHYMQSGDGRVYPTVVQTPNGSLKYLGKDAFDYADSTKTYIQFPSDAAATWFGENYKKGTGVLPKNASGGQHGGLDRWFAEKWVDVKTGKACGRQEGESRAGYPACRPSKRVNSQTPKTSSEMSPAEKAKFKASKTSSQRIDYNHKRNK